MRIGGLASGMDIDTIVKDLMKAERMPLDKLKQNKQVLEWQRDDYRSINTLLLNFRSELTNMRLSSTYRVRTTTSTDDAKITATATSAAGQGTYSISKVTQLATAASKVNAGKISGDKKIDAGKSLFDSKEGFASTEFGWKIGSVESQTINVKEAGKKAKVSLNEGAEIKLSEITADPPVPISEIISIKVNGKSYEVIPSTTAFDSSKTNQVQVDSDGNLNFQESIPANSTIKAEYIADKKLETFKFSEDQAGFQLMKGSITEVSIEVNGKTYTNITKDGKSSLTLYDGEKEIGSIELATGKVTFNNPKELNIQKDTEVTVKYQQNYFTFGLQTDTSKGKINETFFVQGSESLNQVITKVNSSSAGVTMFYDSFSDQVTLTRSEQGNFGNGDQIVTTGDFLNSVLRFDNPKAVDSGQNAKFTINGLETERNSNTFTMNGVTFTLKQTFNSGAVDISINNDSAKVFDNIKGFVEKYNTLIGEMNKKLSEDRYRAYTPLTDEQRESLSDKQQEQWEEKAKSGLLKRDPILSQALSSMRMNFYAPVQNDGINPLYKQLASIGITTTSNYLDGGRLEINEAELKKAIEADPDAVEKLFNATGTTESQKGIAQRLTDSVNGVMDKLKEKAGNAFSTNQQFALGRNLDNVNSRIDRFEDRLKQVEDRYWRQFTAMEKAIQRANQQSAQLMQQFSSGS
ncbi:flagellar filament capping protein FliD [Cytobacillus sp. FJAT-53684]|uniref:Flagellar hook-associated protein 2 n=1 Tax=Cytobacillus mangrovibacter TaxID=3299024 RepID=A0ABW6JXE0_9BACI